MTITATIRLESGQPCEVTSEVYSLDEFEQADPVDETITLTRAESYAANDAIQAAALDEWVSRAELFAERDL